MPEQEDPRELLRRLAGVGSEEPPFHPENQRLIQSLRDAWDQVELIGQAWREEFLLQADPEAGDRDAYVRPVLTLAELFRRHGHNAASEKILSVTLRIIDNHRKERGVSLHRGAVMGNLGIAHLEGGRINQGLACLHAAAQEDIKNHGAKSIYDSYALGMGGIFDQFLDTRVLRAFPNDSLRSIENMLGRPIDHRDLKRFIRWTAGAGDLGLFRGLLGFGEVDGHEDFHSHSTRWMALRDLATLFEVSLKRIGQTHLDPDVQAAFVDGPMLAEMICHMHFEAKKKRRRANPSLSARRSVGLLNNSVFRRLDLVDAIDQHIDACGDRSTPIDDVLSALRTTATSPTHEVDLIARRFLMSYRVRNETSHAFDPESRAVVPHYVTLRDWVLEAVVLAFLWFEETAQIDTSDLPD